MAVLRFQAEYHFVSGSGYPAWLAGQMQVRLGMAIDLSDDEPTHELVTATIYAVDVIWPAGNEALAADTVATFTTPAMEAWLAPDDDLLERRSWARWHLCNHDVDPPEPCDVVEWERTT